MGMACPPLTVLAYEDDRDPEPDGRRGPPGLVCVGALADQDAPPTKAPGRDGPRKEGPLTTRAR